MKRLPKGHKAQIMGTRMFQTMYTADQMREFAQPSKPWVGLMGEEVKEMVEFEDYENDPKGFIEIVEAKLKEKNNG